MDSPVDLDRENRAVGQIELSIEIPDPAARLLPQSLPPWRWQAGARCEGSKINFGQSVPTAADVPENVAHDPYMSDVPRDLQLRG